MESDVIRFRAWNRMVCRMSEPTTLQELYNTKGVQFQNLIFLQWTGIQDKYKKDVYKGDILKTNYCQGVIVWWQNGWHIEVDEHSHHSLNTAIHSFEVMGNVYEHPERNQAKK